MSVLLELKKIILMAVAQSAAASLALLFLWPPLYGICVYPVSYTHLDVYKRQTLNIMHNYFEK